MAHHLLNSFLSFKQLPSIDPSWISSVPFRVLATMVHNTFSGDPQSPWLAYPLLYPILLCLCQPLQRNDPRFYQPWHKQPVLSVKEWQYPNLILILVRRIRQWNVLSLSSWPVMMGFLNHLICGYTFIRYTESSSPLLTFSRYTVSVAVAFDGQYEELTLSGHSIVRHSTESCFSKWRLTHLLTSLRMSAICHPSASDKV